MLICYTEHKERTRFGFTGKLETTPELTSVADLPETDVHFASIAV